MVQIILGNYATGHFIGRRISNTHALVEGLRKIPNVVVSALDFAEFDFDQQLNISRATDLLVGMHGAGLIQTMFMPQWGGLFEFFCPDRPSSNIRYRELTKRLGLHYASFSLEGDSVPVTNVVPLVAKLLVAISRSKTQSY